jgi:hypothetical protein
MFIDAASGIVVSRAGGSAELAGAAVAAGGSLVELGGEAVVTAAVTDGCGAASGAFVVSPAAAFPEHDVTMTASTSNTDE